MKLIIDIPREKLNMLRNDTMPYKGDIGVIYDSVKNGTPLDSLFVVDSIANDASFNSVIEDIKAEINNIDSMTFIGDGSGCASEMRAECLKIIDKHIADMRGDNK